MEALADAIAAAVREGDVELARALLDAQQRASAAPSSSSIVDLNARRTNKR